MFGFIYCFAFHAFAITCGSLYFSDSSIHVSFYCECLFDVVILCEVVFLFVRVEIVVFPFSYLWFRTVINNVFLFQVRCTCKYCFISSNNQLMHKIVF